MLTNRKNTSLFYKDPNPYRRFAECSSEHLLIIFFFEMLNNTSVNKMKIEQITVILTVSLVIICKVVLSISLLDKRDFSSHSDQVFFYTLVLVFFKQLTEKLINIDYHLRFSSTESFWIIFLINLNDIFFFFCDRNPLTTDKGKISD